jgi:cell division septation protein DedD
MVAVGVFAYKAGERRGAEGVAPVIVAGAGPDKVRPEDPGGMDVPNQDKQVYDRLSPDRGQRPAKVERLLPPPEAPMSPPKQVAEAQPNPPSAAPTPPNVPNLSPSSNFSAPLTPKSDAAPAAATPAPSKPVAEMKASPPKPSAAPMQTAKSSPAAPSARDAAKAAAVQPAAGGAYRVQIAALRSEEDAKAVIARARKSGGDLLSGLNFEVKRADLGAKGVYYRVQIGPLADASSASGLCDRLKDRKLGCMVVRP